MIALSDLLKELEYVGSPKYCDTEHPVHLETAHLLRVARDAGVRGVYLFETSPQNRKSLSPRPIVYVAEADTVDKARDIHRSVWNLGYAPFLIVLLPNQLRIYTGFNYAPDTAVRGELGLLDQAQADNLQRIITLIRDFKASSIDSGLIWKSRYYKELDQDQRVDKRLLHNLEKLGETLENDGVPSKTAHALIGKYVYLSYLRSRGILPDNWMLRNRIDPQSIFSLNASVQSLKNLVEFLEERLNGKVFPIDFTLLKDKHISWVASVFSGSEVMDSAPGPVHQLCLPFKAYDFRYIPVETLSSIYEQFIRDRKEKGAIYTPEVLADYLLSEMESLKPLVRGMKILDPACGSGVFLVLAYRRLIEKEIQRIGAEGKLDPELLRDILEESIFGIERERDACYVAEFSLILTFLHYVDLPQLQSTGFRFPGLHNTQIVEADFFDNTEESIVRSWQRLYKFDWIVGNPPWTELKPSSQNVEFVRAWIDDPKNRKEFPVMGKRVAEAFSWHVTELLDSNGLVGLVLPATSLFNRESQKYRQAFFTKNDVLKVTDFANLREVLFGKEKSGVLPAMTVVYRHSVNGISKPDIIHYAPFFINQVFPTKDTTNKPWVLVINEDEIKTLSPNEAATGEMTFWKLALWGTYRDKRTIEVIKHLFPTTLEQFCEQRGWGKDMPRQGAELRSEREDPHWPKANLEENAREFQTKIFNAIEPRPWFSFLHPEVLKEIKGDRFIRCGEETLYLTTPPPHLILSKAWQNFAIYSDEDFVVPPQQLVIAAPKEPKNNADYLRALAVYLSSSLVAYYLFFHVPEWGVFRQRKSVITTEVRKIPTPKFTSYQVRELANLHRELVARESATKSFLPDRYRRPEDAADREDNNYWIGQVAERPEEEPAGRFGSAENELRGTINEKIYSLLDIPEQVRLIVDEFVRLRLLLDRPSARYLVTRHPTAEELLVYAQQLQNELNGFVMDKERYHIQITYSDELVECCIEVAGHDVFIPVKPGDVRAGTIRVNELMKELGNILREPINQWIHIQRGLRLYDGPRIYIYKTPRLIDWTQTQAVDDAADIIGDLVRSRYQE